jgi:glutamine kinase
MVTSKPNPNSLSGTKAETLLQLAELGYNVPFIYYFTVQKWIEDRQKILIKIIKLFPGCLVAIRSSTLVEDGEESSKAGTFMSLLNIRSEKEDLIESINSVIKSYDKDLSNQVLVQPMVDDVVMSGVIMTKVLDDGSPYHVINYDDSTGLTDTVTSGTTINKTVYVYNGVNEQDFDSPYLLSLLRLIRKLEHTYSNIPLDIEFAIDGNRNVHLLQVRRITTIKNWKKNIIDQVSEKMVYLKDYIQKIMKPRPNLFGKYTLLGFMPDWNPAEMIGVVPHPLSMSLYRELITKSTWRIAREKMGYRKMPKVELMVSLFGRVYIDVRNSINSFLPEGLDDKITEKLVNAYINRLDNNPHLHDKIEFEVVHTAYDFDFEKNFNARYPGLLNREDFLQYKGLLRKLTIHSILDDDNSSSITAALNDIEKLKKSQFSLEVKKDLNSFSIADKINTLISDCIEYGTIPFSILARHAFIAEGILRSAVNQKVIQKERIKAFKQSTSTIAGKMSKDFYNVLEGKLSKKQYLKKYGHLRPSSYDILSPNYANRPDLFDGAPKKKVQHTREFKLTKQERTGFNVLLWEHGFDGITAEHLFDYAKKAIQGREYAKFIFTKHLSIILEYVAEWGKLKGLSRKEMSLLTINDVLSILFAPLTNKIELFYREKIKKAWNDYQVASSFKLSYLIRSERDVYIVPMQRSSPNFIGNQRIESEVVELNPYLENVPELENKIICIEGADPGYDWIFTRNIAGLVTKYGGANSHMAIRSAELNIPAAIGCGEQPFERILKAQRCLLDCKGKRLEPIDII